MNDQRIKSALSGAVVSKGPGKGKVKAKCPPLGSDAAAAWMAIMAFRNPLAISVMHQLAMPDDTREEVYKPLMRHFAVINGTPRSV